MDDSAYLIKLNYVGVVEPLHDVHLSVDLLQVSRIQLGFVYYLDGHLQREESKLVSPRVREDSKHLHKNQASGTKSNYRQTCVNE